MVICRIITHAIHIFIYFAREKIKKESYGNRGLRACAFLQEEVFLLRVLLGGGDGMEGEVCEGIGEGGRHAGRVFANARGRDVVCGRGHAVVPGRGGVGEDCRGVGAAVCVCGGGGADYRGES